MKTGKHQQPAQPRRSRRRAFAPLLFAAVLVLVLLILILPRLGGKAPAAPAEDALTRGMPPEGEAPDFLPPLTDYTVSFQLENGVLTVSGNGAMPALERAFTDQERAAVETVVLDPAVTSLDAEAFRGCTRLRAITLPEGLSAIGAAAFDGCRLETLTVPASVTQIAEGAFSGCGSLREILVQSGNPACVSVDGVLYSADRSLLLCFPAAKSSRGFRVPEGVTRIAACAFSGYQLTETLYLPASLQEIGAEAFTRCYGLAAFKVDGGCPAFTAADGVLYDKEKRVLLRYPSAKTSQRFSVPRGVEEIAPGAFCENYELSSLTLPDSLARIGDRAFSGCSFLRSVSFPRSLLSIGAEAFLSCSRLQEVSLPEGLESLGDQAFAYCYELHSLELPAGLRELGREIFLRCDSLVSVAVPDGFSAIGGAMFRQCGALETVRLPASLSSVGPEAFLECGALKTIRYAGTQAQWDAVEIGDSLAIPDGAEILIEG